MPEPDEGRWWEDGTVWTDVGEILFSLWIIWVMAGWWGVGIAAFGATVLAVGDLLGA